MIKYVKKNGRSLLFAFLFILTATAAAVILQFFKGTLLDSAIAGDGIETMRYSVILIFSILAETGFFYLYRRQSSKFVVRCTALLKEDIFAAILRLGFAQFKKHSQGEYIAKYTNEADLVKDRYFAMLPGLLEILLKVLFVSLSLFVLDYRIALTTLFLLTTPLYIPKLIQKRLQRANADYIRAVEENLAKLNNWLAGFEIIFNFSAAKEIAQKHRSSNNEVMQKLLSEQQLGNVAQLLSMLISYISHFIIIILAAYFVLYGSFTAGGFFVAVGLIDQLSYPLIALSGTIRLLVGVRPTCSALEAFVSTGERHCEGLPLTCMEQGIAFEDVLFSYEEGRPILDHFNLPIPKGSRCLIEEASGCGKTTAINLLLKYYEISGGQLRVDGIPIDEFGDVRNFFTIVRQEAILFNDTLRNNLTMYQTHEEHKLIAVLNRLGLSKFANTQALDALITEDGTNLSGGEKKRICLARALLRESQVLILDEPLANLDADTAKRIEALLFSIEERTLIVVSHQFSMENREKFDVIVQM